MVIYSQQNTQLIRKTAVNCFNADWRTTTVLWFSQTKQENKLTKGSKQACCLHYWKHWRVYQWRSEKVNLRDRDLVQSTRPERETLTKRQRPKFERLRPGSQIRKLSRIVKKFQKCIKKSSTPRGVPKGGQEEHNARASNHRWATKSHKNVATRKYFLQYSTFASERH